jgi:hypothetical protein
MTNQQRQFLLSVLREDRGLIRGIHVTEPTAADFQTCQQMVAAGYMAKLPAPVWLHKNDAVFKVTPKGRQAVVTQEAA